MKIHQKISLVTTCILLLSFSTLQVKAQTDASKEATIISAMKNSENDWNKGDLDSFMKMYTDASTMMMPTGPAGLSTIRDLYQKKYFDGKTPKQNLHYDEILFLVEVSYST